ncbi:fused MFS/spermidine synthase [candidate division KSB1 bacterium]
MRDRWTNSLIFIFFFISGAAGLVYEVIWTRMFTLVFGNTILSVSTVLSAFMAGLALGSYYFGKLIDNKKNYLKFYAILECGIGITAFLIPFLIHYLNYFYSIIFNIFGLNYYVLSIVRFLMSFILMLIPTTMMGGTLPVLVKYFTKKERELGRKVGSLYSINTFGGVTGCFLAGFYIIRIIGVNQSVFLFAAVNLLIGIFVWLLSRHETEEDVAVSEKIITNACNEVPESKYYSRGIGKTVLFGFALSGFCALAYEVLWTRIIVYIISVSVYAFTIMLSTFLLGLAFGGYVGGKLSDRFNGLKLFSIFQVLIGLSALGTVYVLGDFPNIHKSIALMFEGGSWYKWNLMRFVETAVILFLPTVFMGAIFPVVGKVWTENIKKVGKSIGEVYSLNTVGAVLGSLAAGFIIIPLFGTPQGIMYIAFINILIGAVVLYLIPNLRYQVKIPVIAILFVLIIIQPFFIEKDMFLSLMNNFEKGSELIYFDEGISGTVTIHQYPDYYRNGKVISIDGTNVAGTEFMLRTTQKLQGHLPLLLHGNPKLVLQIGFGSGETSDAILLNDVERLDMAELSQDVLDAADEYFSELNKHVLKNDRLNPIIMDGKNYGILTREKYDVIMNDATYPTKGACAALYTKEHFLTLKGKLTENGVVSTWVPLDLAPYDFKLILNTFQSVFPNSYYWYVSNSTNKHGILIGTKNKLKIDYNRFVEMMSKEEIHNDLDEVNLGNPVALLDGLLLNEEDIKELTKEFPVNTDNKPILEFSQNYLRDRRTCEISNISDILKFKKTIFPYLVNIGKDKKDEDELKQELEKYSKATKVVIVGHLADRRGVPGIRRKRYNEALKINPNDLNAKYLLERIEIEEVNLKKRLEAEPSDYTNYSNLALYYIKENRFEESVDYLKKAIALNPKYIESYFGLGGAYLRLGQMDNAKETFNKLISVDPTSSDIRFRISNLYSNIGMRLSALRELEEAKRLNPNNADIRYNLGNAYYRNKELVKAIIEYREAIKLNPNDVSYHFNLANCYALGDQFENALDEYREALKLDPNDPNIRFNSATAFLKLNKVDEGIYQFKQTIRLNPFDARAYANLGSIYESLGDFDEALEMYEKAVETDSLLVPTYWIKGKLYYKQGYIEKAISSLKDYIKYVKDPSRIGEAEKMIQKILRREEIE